jgi:dGTPase
MRDYGGFNHNDQALRIVTRLEERYAGFDGLNLTWETLEGLVKHNGPLIPLKDGGKLPVTIAAFRNELDLELDGYPGLEAQVAALADDIAYNTHDIEDGLRAGFFTLDELADLPLVGPCIEEVTTAYPKLDQGRTIHETTRRLIDTLVRDVVAETERRLLELAPDSVEDVREAGRPMVTLSRPVSKDEKLLREFLTRRLYRDYRVNRMTSKARRLVRDLFDHFMSEPETLPTPWQMAIDPADSTQDAKARVIADYIAGMTDRYALAEHQRIFDFQERRT